MKVIPQYGSAFSISGQGLLLLNEHGDIIYCVFIGYKLSPLN